MEESILLQPPTTPAEVKPLAMALQAELEQVVQGQTAAVQCLLVSLIAGGHVLLEGVPGVAKTLLVRCLAASLQASFARIQFTPDLMPADITGVNVFDTRAASFHFRPGPLFADLVLADEINRAPARTQAALLEAMQEGQVSVDGETRGLSPCFMVVATQNPIDFEGTYPLPEAQLDRFLMKVIMGYPSEAAERNMLKVMQSLGSRASQPAASIRPLASREVLMQLRSLVWQVTVDETVRDYLLRLVRESRSHAHLTLGGSPRAGVMLMQASRGLALLRGRDFVSPDDVQAMAVPVLSHRVHLAPEAELEGITREAAIKALLARVPIPR